MGNPDCLVNSALNCSRASRCNRRGQKCQRDLPTAFKSCAAGSIDQCAAEHAGRKPRDNYAPIRSGCALPKIAKLMKRSEGSLRQKALKLGIGHLQ